MLTNFVENNKCFFLNTDAWAKSVKWRAQERQPKNLLGQEKENSQNNFIAPKLTA